MPCKIAIPTIALPPRAGLARQLLLAGTVLLMLAGSALAETPAKRVKGSGSHIVSDSVRLAGGTISGGWRETAADGSWRRVEFALGRDSGSVTFGDGPKGRRLPGVTHYAASGAGPKGSPATYDEIRTFADAAPGIRDKANRSSPIPSGIASRIRELGGDFKLLQRLMDVSKRGAGLGSAFDAARRPADGGGVFAGRPGGSPGEGNWSNPRRGVGRDGRASDGTKSPGYDGGPKNPDSLDRGNGEIRNADGSSTTVSSWSDADSRGYSQTHRDSSGQVSHGDSERVDAAGNRISQSYVVSSSGEVFFTKVTVTPDGHRTEHHGSHHGGGVTPPETGGSSGGYDEAWLYRSLPWLMDALYANWKRENDLVKSGGRIAQPGRSEAPSTVANESPRVGASAVVNCGDSNTNPCARAEGTGVDTRGRLSELTQPPRDGLTGGTFGGTLPPPPMPNPQANKP